MTNNIFAFNFDFANADNALAFSQIMAIATQYNVQYSMVTDSVRTAEQPKAKAPKVYADTTDVVCKWVVDGTHVGYTTVDDKYVGQSGVRKVLNGRLRMAGATYNAEKKAWVFKTKAAASKFAETSATVTAQEWDEQRAKAQARAERKATK